MRPSIFLVTATLALAAQASWFGGSSSSDNDPEYKSWNTNELQAWLEVHNVPIPKHAPTQAELKDLVEENWDTASVWTYDQYASAQQAFQDLREAVFETWDESRLRQFLLEHGVVAPKGTRENLVLLAKQKHRSYTKAASSLSAEASARASTAVYGDTAHQMSKSVSSVASQATREATAAFDMSKDYVYSSWSENQMRAWLQERGLLKTKAKKRKDELLQMLHDAWGYVANPVWVVWSDSYIRNWLVAQHVIKSDYEARRDELAGLMEKYYYNTRDSVYDSWSDSDLKKWLVEHGVMKSDAKASRDKMLKMVEDNYMSAKDTFWSAWSDNAIRDWLIENGYMRSGAQAKRDELIKLANEKYASAHAQMAEYLKWPDARLRATLRAHGYSDEHLPGDRLGLLQEVRIRYVRTQTTAEAIFTKIKDLVNSGIYKAEDALHHLMAILNTGWEDTKEKSYDGYEEAKHRGDRGWEDAKRQAGNAEGWAAEKVNGAREKVGEKVKVGGQKIKGEL
ncbi:unnamed protein product [Cyclocybe aegerita]|uniref:Uncharacterized protein n=1 Tax=Cyclocybe aegerita TaxID=1973307 RepID=A0A8S0W9B8_CYCAE|nr:unnamed protein product [Cyclocybe aegerita]